MSIEIIKMPGLGESVTEASLEKWLTAPNEPIQKYDPIAEVMSDKVSTEIPASFTGVVKKLLINEGDMVPIGTPIMEVEVEGSTGKVSVNEVEETSQQPVATPEEKTGKKPRLSPVVARMIEENNLDVEAIQGTGNNGRITKTDVRKFMKSGAKEGIKPPTISEQPQTERPVSSVAKVEEVVPAKEIVTGDDRKIIQKPSATRRMIADRMVKSTTEIPHAWLVVEADVTELVKLRNQLKADYEKENGHKLTYFPFFLQAVARAIRQYPVMNSSWQQDQIIQYKDVNLSIAVATEEYLYVPVIKQIDQRSIAGIASEVNRLSRDIKQGQMKMEDMQGGTFTVNNTGTFGSVQSMGVINYPQAAILQVESIRKELKVVGDNEVAIRDVVNLCLSIDHRMLDGLVAGNFLKAVKEQLEAYSVQTSIY